MNILTFGSCMSHITAGHMRTIFGANVLSSVTSVRSDIFYHYYIAKDKQIIPRKLIEENLIISKEFENDPNYISPNRLLDYQYPDAEGRYSFSRQTYEKIKNKKFDIMIIDNHVDISSKLSYWKHDDQYKESPILLRKQDYENFDDYFTLGEQLSCSKSIEYINLIIDFCKLHQPNLKVYFINYPYNTYVNNSKRQTKARLFERTFQRNDITIIPAPTVPKLYQKENDPAHFQSEIYISLAGYISVDFDLKMNKDRVYNFLNNGQLIEENEDSIEVPEIGFNEDSSWSVALSIFEYATEKQFNFILGKFGVLDGSVLRRRNYLEFRTSGGDYISGVEFKLGCVNNIAVIYNKGDLLFYCNGNTSKVNNCFSKFQCNRIGNSYSSQYNSSSVIKDIGIWEKIFHMMK